MRLHTNELNANHIHRATAHLPGVYATVTEHGSRSHKRAYEVRLEGNGYRRNTGTSGADYDEVGATWDEWGAFLAALYEIDPDALWGSAKRPVYRNAATFHYLTHERFITDADPGHLPADTHKRHKWDWTAEGAQCTKCSAYQRRTI